MRHKCTLAIENSVQNRSLYTWIIQIWITFPPLPPDRLQCPPNVCVNVCVLKPNTTSRNNMQLYDLISVAMYVYPCSAGCLRECSWAHACAFVCRCMSIYWLAYKIHLCVCVRACVKRTGSEIICWIIIGLIFFLIKTKLLLLLAVGWCHRKDFVLKLTSNQESWKRGRLIVVWWSTSRTFRSYLWPYAEIRL